MYSANLGGRFLQTDPIGFAGGVNPYVLNDPVNWVDPSGLQANGGAVQDLIVIACQNGGTAVPIRSGYICIAPLQDTGSGSGGGGHSGGGGGGGGGGGDAEGAQTISPCMQQFLASQGYGSPNLPSIEFHRGTDGSMAAKIAFNVFGNPAITIGNNIYVSPSAWDAGQFGPGTSGFFEETIHSIQWSQSGQANFVASWIGGSASAMMMTGHGHDSPLEAEAIIISHKLQTEYQNARAKCR
jgi:hypothetical protein